MKRLFPRARVLTFILAGGAGRRLSPLTDRCCKPAVSFGGSFRIIDFTLINCLCSQLRRVHVLTQYHSHSLNAHLGERWGFLSRQLGEFIETRPPALRTPTGLYAGTADAVFRNLDLIREDRPDVVLVLSGDHVYRADYEPFIAHHLERDADVTILAGTVPTAQASSYGVIETTASGRVHGFVEKPPDPESYARGGYCDINLGVYCFNTDFLIRQLLADAKRASRHDFGLDVLPHSVAEGAVVTCPLELLSPDQRSYWRDVGTLENYFEAHMDLLGRSPRFDLRDPRWREHPLLQEWVPASYETTARFERRMVAGANILASGVRVRRAQIANCVVGPRCEIGDGAELEECVLLPGARIGDGARLRRVIVGEDVVVPPVTALNARDGLGDEASVLVVASGGEAPEPKPPAERESAPDETLRSAPSRVSTSTGERERRAPRARPLVP